MPPVPLRCLGFTLLRERQPAEAMDGHPPWPSICTDYCCHLPDTWCLDWVQPRQPPEWCPAEAVAALTACCTEAFGQQWAWPSLATDLDWLRRLHQAWGRQLGCTIRAFACADADADAVIAATRPPPQQPGFAPMGALGHHLMATRGQPTDPGWRLLGWEVLELNPVSLGDAHVDPDHIDPISRLMPYAAARALARALDHDRSDRCHAPIAHLAVDE